ncbi:hypothetical protein [Anaerocolumna sp. MB42-C2]|uniref:hypothetical protein n=1 Tax=Anaerocolumna sp. MB42-C2 TaxID=3070997 RepID=UPI002ED5C257
MVTALNAHAMKEQKVKELLKGIISLGLPLAKTILEAHDGSITVDSILGEGSVFVMNFLNLTKM